MGNIKLFDDKKVRSKWDEKEEKWYFYVQDVIEILTDTVDVKDYIKKMKKRDAQLNANLGTICPLVEMEAADGRKRKIQAADTKGLLRIIQSDQSLQERIFSATQEKLKSKKIPPLQKNKTSPPHNPRQTSILTSYEYTQTGTATGHSRRKGIR